MGAARRGERRRSSGQHACALRAMAAGWVNGALQEFGLPVAGGVAAVAAGADATEASYGAS